MTPEELLQSLKTLPRPRLSPFFAARVAQQTKPSPAAAPVPLALRFYWLLLAFFAGVVLLQTWVGVGLIIAAAGVVALTPAGALPPTASRRELHR